MRTFFASSSAIRDARGGMFFLVIIHSSVLYGAGSSPNATERPNVSWNRECSLEGMPKPKHDSAPGAARFLPAKPTLTRLRSAAAECRGCDLWKSATQTVFGEGGMTARIVFVGEQPGDQEDKQGRPFVGPAGRILTAAMDEAGIARSDVYVTNIVKHFKWEPRGKRRIHKKPSSEEVTACRPWFEAEIALLQPEVIVCLGATAAQAILGRQFKVSTARGKWIESPLAPHVTATVHPSSLLRMPDEESRREGMKAFVEDLKQVRTLLGKLSRDRPGRVAS